MGYVQKRATITDPLRIDLDAATTSRKLSARSRISS
jgi:hypothetical protein